MRSGPVSAERIRDMTQLRRSGVRVSICIHHKYGRQAVYRLRSLGAAIKWRDARRMFACRTGVAMPTLLKEPPIIREGTASEAPLISVAEYHRRIETGELGSDDRVELIRGQLVGKMPKDPLHAAVVRETVRMFDSMLPKGFITTKEDPVTLSDSEPEPDVVVVRGTYEQFYDRHPSVSEVAFVVEVSASSLRLDRQIKQYVYAENGIPRYWIVNLVDFQIEVFEDPADGEYRMVRVYAKDVAVPIVVDGSEIGRISLNELTKTKQGA